MRKFIASCLTWLANKAIRKYNTSIILIYGWDWTEGLREGIYNLLKPNYSIRRNTEMISWDLGLPLFILGQPYVSRSSRLGIILSLLKAAVSLLRPSKYKKNILVISLSAKSLSTIGYWVKLDNPTDLVILPELKDRNTVAEYLLERVSRKVNIIDLRTMSRDEVKPDLLMQLDKHKLFRFNQIQLKLLQILSAFAGEFSESKAKQFTSEEILVAVSKIDWQSNLLQRIKLNITNRN